MLASDKKINSIPVTTGMTHEQLYEMKLTKPKHLTLKAGQISHDYGIIPGLRKPDRRRRNFSVFDIKPRIYN